MVDDNRGFLYKVASHPLRVGRAPREYRTHPSGAASLDHCGGEVWVGLGDGGRMSSFVQLEGSPGRVHVADQPETVKRCEGKLHDALG